MSTEPIGLAQDLPPKGVMRAQIGTTDLAVWRSASGVVSAWENRCPHRGMRLSHGFVRGESLACAYHGWHYNCAGKCHYIPAHPELEPPGKITPVIYSVVEQADVIWVNTEDEAKPVHLPTDVVGVRRISIQSNLATVIEAFSAGLPAKFSAKECISIDTVKVFSEHPKVLSFNTSAGADAVFVLFQQPDSDTVITHVLAKAHCSTDELIALSRWCEAVRRNAEGYANAPAIINDASS